jgi:thymidylate synthase (FAD)
MRRVDVLDHGFVVLQEVMGDALTVVNTARVSYGRQKEQWEESDQRLLHYLIRHQHTSPFRHVMFRFHLKAPEMVMRQIYKHVVGSEWFAPTSTQLHGWNEISGRYVELHDVYKPTEWRAQSQSSKQGSEGPLDGALSAEIAQEYGELTDRVLGFYHRLCERGVAKEQARAILPLGTYTECIWTVSFQAVMNFLGLRLDHHAQHEVQEYARAIQTLVGAATPILYQSWSETTKEIIKS